MARTIAEIKATLVAAKEAETELADVNSTSKVAEWNLWLDIVAFCTYTLEQLFDFFRIDVDTTIATMKPHTLQWYVAKAKAFQFGITLPPDTDVYPVIPEADSPVFIVKSAAAEEVFALNLVRMKVAKQGAGGLEPLDPGPDPGVDPDSELGAFSEYMRRIKDAGVRLQVTSGEPDDLYLQLDVYYDPLVLNGAGERLDTVGSTPVKDAVNAFIGSLPFNSLFILNELIDAIEAVDGVVIAHVPYAEAVYASLPPIPIPVKYIPDAGYMKLHEGYFDTWVNYLPQSSEVVS